MSERTTPMGVELLATKLFAAGIVPGIDVILTGPSIPTDLMEMADQVMTPLDFEMAAEVHQHLKAKKVEFYLNEDGTVMIDEFEFEDDIDDEEDNLLLHLDNHGYH